ncbi:MAG TPA: KamA family radical SAM protein [Desulfobacteraceae bacterium]|nr:KamA family radical SAM protein [Desulfobacteraceae bacterium]
MISWQKLLGNSITDAGGLPGLPRETVEEIEKVTRVYPMRINPYYLRLMRQAGPAISRQAVPDIREIRDGAGMTDPLDEENLSPVPNLVHKYPDRVLFLVSGQCAMYCRFCTRKRKVGRPEMAISDATIRAGLDYIETNRQVREVLLSGGDPLLLADRHLEKILRSLRRIPHVEVIRIGTRVPCTLPQRVTAGLAAMLRKYHPLYINTHFNHPAEITPEASLACAVLADAGIPLGCQTVLLRGINDDREIIRDLMCRLVRIRVKPYYLFQADLARGTDHFRTPIDTGLEIMRHLIGRTSGLAVPTFAVDAPGGGGKIPLTPDYIRSLDEKCLRFTNYQGLQCSYPNPPGIPQTDSAPSLPEDGTRPGGGCILAF